MKNKKVIFISIIILAIVGVFILFTGGVRTDVYLEDFSINENDNQMIIKVGVSGSTGYVRKMKQTSGSTNYYYTFYSTFGINSKLGAKDTFEIQLDNNVDEIYFYTGQKGYKKVLEKNEQGEWKRTYVQNDVYQHISSLAKNEYASTEILVKFDGVLYGKSNAIIDYAKELDTQKIGTINKLIDKELVPKLDNETNTEELLFAEVYNKTEDSIVLLYDNEYVLFGKINE